MLATQADEKAVHSSRIQVLVSSAFDGAHFWPVFQDFLGGNLKAFKPEFLFFENSKIPRVKVKISTIKVNIPLK